MLGSSSVELSTAASSTRKTGRPMATPNNKTSAGSIQTSLASDRARPAKHTAISANASRNTL